MTTYRTTVVDGLTIFYREAGSPDAPTLVLLHGIPAASHSYEGPISALAGRFHLIAPDFPGFGYSDSPDPKSFEYSFAHLADFTAHFLQTLDITRFSLYVHDYGAPIGFRLAVKHPEWIETLIIQNGNAYEEGLASSFTPIREYWQGRTASAEAAVATLLSRETIMYFYQHGTRHPEQINPDNFVLDEVNFQRPGNRTAQLDLFYDYRTNVQQYETWHNYFRQYQPPTLVVWGKNDPFFTVEGARAYGKDLKTIEMKFYDTGHYALEEDGHL